MLFDGKLGMEDEEPFDDEPPFEPLEMNDDLELGKIIIRIIFIVYAKLYMPVHFYNMSEVYMYMYMHNVDASIHFNEPCRNIKRGK